MARKAKTPNTSYKIRVLDVRYTGDEPIWDNWEQWDLEKFKKERSRAFNFYNYYLDAVQTKGSVFEWMEQNGYSKSDIEAVKAAPDYYPGITAGTLCICMGRGMPAVHPSLKEEQRSDVLFVREALTKAISEGRRVKQTDDIKVESAPAISPMILLQAKAMRTVIMDLDVMLDSWIKTKGAKVRRIDLYETMNRHDLSSLVCPLVERWLTRLLNEMVEARDKTNPDSVEGYRYLTGPELRDRIDATDQMLKDLGRYCHAAKATRAPRKKRAKPADKQITKLKYRKEDTDFKIASINPIRVVGAYRLLAFNTERRVLLDYVAQSAEGFSIKGTSLKNVDETNSRCTRLRKPNEFLEIVLNNTAKQIEKAWEKLTTKEGKPKVRINEDVVLLRVFDQKD